MHFCLQAWPGRDRGEGCELQGPAPPAGQQQQQQPQGGGRGDRPQQQQQQQQQRQTLKEVHIRRLLYYTLHRTKRTKGVLS